VADRYLVPPDDALDSTRRDYVRRRLDDIQAETRYTLNLRVLALGRHDAEVRALEARFAEDERRVLAAEAEDRTARALAPAPALTEPAPGPARRVLGGPALAGALAGCLAVGYLAAHTALDAVALPVRLGPLLATAVALGLVGAGTAVGRLLRRACDLDDNDVLAPERSVIRTLGVAAGAGVVGLAVMRGMSAPTALTLVTFAGGTAAVLVAVAASFLHTDVALDRLDGAARRLRLRRRQAAHTGRRLARARARRRDAVDDLRTGAAAVVARVEATYDLHRVHLGDSEPAWLTQLRGWAAGVELPYGPARDGVL